MAKSNGFYKFGRCVCSVVFKPFYRYKYINKNSIKDDKAYIIACNHISNSDPVLLGIGQKRTVNYMAKAELFNNKFLAKLITALGAFPVDRGSGDGKAINTADELLNSGELVAIFIEGTRSKTGEFLRPRSGVSIIAHATNTPVIPVCITAVSKHLFAKRIIHYGEPITPQELGLIDGTPKEYREASRRIMEKIAALREQDLNEYHSR